MAPCCTHPLAPTCLCQPRTSSHSAPCTTPPPRPAIDRQMLFNCHFNVSAHLRSTSAQRGETVGAGRPQPRRLPLLRLLTPTQPWITSVRQCIRAAWLRPMNPTPASPTSATTGSDWRAHCGTETDRNQPRHRLTALLRPHRPRSRPPGLGDHTPDSATDCSAPFEPWNLGDDRPTRACQTRAPAILITPNAAATTK